MKTSDFDYDLPKELIAQDPLEDRSASRLMVLHRKSGTIEHRVFHDIVEYLRPGDCLVRNNTKVIPARLFGMREDTGATIELLLLKRRQMIEKNRLRQKRITGRKLKRNQTYMIHWQMRDLSMKILALQMCQGR